MFAIFKAAEDVEFCKDSMQNNGKKWTKIPNLQIYTIKTPLTVSISISTFFSWSQKPDY